MKNQQPHVDLQLEQLYIRSCILTYRQGHLANEASRLATRDCHSQTHAAILDAAYAVADSGRVVDAFSLEEALARTPELIVLLRGVLSAPETSRRVEQMAQKLRAMARRRRRHMLIMKAVALSLDARDDDVTMMALDVAADETERRDDEFLTGQDVAFRALEYFASQQQITSRKTGFLIVDQAIGSLQPQSMTVIAGGTGAGKSQLMLAMAVHQAMHGTPVGIVSIEDPITTWGPRLAAHFSEVNPDQIAPGMDPEIYTRTAAACQQISETAGIHFAFEIGRPLADVLRAIRHACVRHACKVIYVDYVQALGWSGEKGQKRAEFISQACSQMKACAAEHNASLVLGSQFNRPEKGHEFKEPQLSWIKESGDIENMAEVVVLLWKNGDTDSAVTMGKIAKVKWSAKRPRFAIDRHPRSGAIVGIDQPPAKEDAPPARGATKSTWRRNLDDDERVG